MINPVWEARTKVCLFQTGFLFWVYSLLAKMHMRLLNYCEELVYHISVCYNLYNSQIWYGRTWLDVYRN